MRPPDFDADADQYIVFEGETDNMAAWQATTEKWKGRLLAVSGAEAWKALCESGELEAVLGKAKRVFIVTDNDDPYENPDASQSVERGWQKARDLLGRKARRVTLPKGTNDAAEFFQQYDWAAFHVLLKKAAEPQRHFRRLDLSKPVPPVDWLVDDLFVRGELTVLTGPGGVGKSWFTMALALAVAGGQSKYLGLPVRRHGTVLYVDEENSEQLVHMRLHALSSSEAKPFQPIPPKAIENLEYLWYAGVLMDTAPELLLEEAREFEPELIVIDSQSRVSLSTKENDNSEIMRLYQAGFIPLARETGAAVVVLHHTPVDNAGRPRGAGNINNAADQTIAIMDALNKQGEKTGIKNIFPSKPRRLTTYLNAQLRGNADKEGWTVLEPYVKEDPY